jgi:serine/threonine protein kinase
MYSEVTSTSEVSSTTQGSDFRYMAPELFGNSDDDVAVRSTKYSDIYSFGGIMLQVCLGNL